MRARHGIGAALVAAAALVGVTGCTNPDAPPAGAGGSGVQSPGEPAAPPPRQGRAPADLQRSPRAALAQYARIYSNWSYKTLAAAQRQLAAISTGSARLTDRQAATQTAADTTLARSKVENSGSVLAVAPSSHAAGEWVVVTRERTSGGGEYEALPAQDHVTLARVAHVQGGWAVRQWLPQS